MSLGSKKYVKKYLIFTGINMDFLEKIYNFARKNLRKLVTNQIPP